MITFLCYMYELQNGLTLSLWAYVLPVITIGGSLADRISRRR